MKLAYFSLAALTLLTACGGGGGGSKKPSPSSTAQSSVASSLAESSISSALSSVSSAQSSSTASIDTAGIVFADSFNDDWGQLTRLEADPSYVSSTDQTGDYLIYWSEKDIGGEHGNVLEIRYTNKDVASAQFEVTGDKDLSAYSTGTFSFDIQVVPQETPSADDASLPIEMQYQVECFWPCTSHTNYFTLTEYSEWKRVQIDVEKLIKSGLDISAVVKSLTLRPVQGNLQNATFLMDNIQWKKGTQEIVERSPVFLASFNEYKDLDDWALSSSESLVGLSLSSSYGISIGTGDRVQNLELTHTLDTPINTSGKNIGAIIRAGDALTATGSVSLELMDSHGNIASTPAVSFNKVALERPYQFLYSIDSELNQDNSFDAENVTQIVVVVRFPNESLSKKEGYDNFFSVDEIVIE